VHKISSQKRSRLQESSVEGPSARWGKLSVHAILIVVGLACIIPMVLVISISLSDEKSLALEGYSLLPVGFTTSAYTYILQNPGQILRAYAVTVFVTAFGTSWRSLHLFVAGLRHFAQGLQVSHTALIFVFFTLLFNGGMVPFYIVVTRYLGLKDNILALILPYMVTAWYVLILRTSFAQLPKDLLDAGRIDGAGEWRIFYQIVIPLSKPVLATIGLFYILRYWNDWFLALLFIDTAPLYPLQYLLYVLMTNIMFLASNPQTTGMAIPTQSARMAMAVLAFGPALFAFLLLQKYFVRGITIGGLKG
jgi:putative aldouronate transport system permease protein